GRERERERDGERKRERGMECAKERKGQRCSDPQRSRPYLGRQVEREGLCVCVCVRERAREREREGERGRESEREYANVGVWLRGRESGRVCVCLRVTSH